MRKIIASMNMTLDGFCDHTAGIADDELHQFFADLISKADVLIYGRTTYQMMESYWPAVVENPTGNQPMDDFAVQIDNISKIVYSRTLDHVDWKNSTLKKEIVKDEMRALRQQSGKDILVGSPGLIVAFTQLGLIDHYLLCVHPVILGSGLTLFKNIKEQVDLKLLSTKTFASGVMALNYEAKKK